MSTSKRNRAIWRAGLACALTFSLPVAASANSRSLRDPVSHMVLELPDGWRGSVTANKQKALRVAIESGARRHGLFVFAWTTRRPASGGDQILVMNKVKIHGADIARKLAGTRKEPGWSRGSNAATSDLRFPVAMAPKGPFKVIARGPKGTVRGTLWHGKTFAFAVYAWSAKPPQQKTTSRMGRRYRDRYLKKYRQQRERYDQGRLQLNQALGGIKLDMPRGKDISSMAVWWGAKGLITPKHTFSIPLPAGYHAVTDKRHFCRSNLASFRCEYATNGTTEILAVVHRVKGDTGDTTYSLNEGKYTAYLRSHLGLTTGNQQEWSWWQRFKMIPAYYSSGRLPPVSSPEKEGQKQSIRLFKLGSKTGIAVVVSSSSAKEAQAVEAYIERAGYNKPSGLYKAMYFGGVLLSWIFGVCAFLLFSEKSETRSLQIGIPTGLVGLVFFGVHMVSSPPVPSTFLSATILAFLPLILVLLALLSVFGD